MAGTKRTQVAMDALFADGQPDNTGTPLLVRDLIASAVHSRIVTERGHMTYDDDTGAQALASGVRTKIVNDGAGAQTEDAFKPLTVTQFYNTTTNQFDFSDLNVGDQLMIRVDIIPTTGGTNTELEMEMDAAIGGVEPFTQAIHHDTYKTAGSQPAFSDTFLFTIETADVRDNPAELYIETDSASSIMNLGVKIAVI